MSLLEKSDFKKAKLTSRQKTIIEILTRFTPTNPVTISAISEELKLSSRTILREIPKIEKWLSDNHFKFIRKPGVGLIIDESIENQKLILELLEIENIEKSYSKEERRKLILLELLSNKEPLKSLYFTSKFKISEGTFINDIDFLSEWLKNFNISVIKKTGVGIYINGNEDSYRQAISNAVCEFMTEEAILNVLNSTDTINNSFKLPTNYQNRIFSFIDNKTMKVVEEILIYIEKKLHIKYTDSAYMGLIIHISLAIKRIQNFEEIKMENEKLSKLEIMPEFSVAEEISKLINKKLNVLIPKDEIGYITIHLLSAKIWINEKNKNFDFNNINIKQIVINIINIVENELNIYLRDNEMLIDDLKNHIKPVLSRLSMNVRIKNSQLKTIKENYPDIYKATEKACNILKETLSIKKVYENEVAFIAMHFCAAVEKLKTVENKISAVIVCPTGIGTSKMLSINILKYFNNINIKYTMSAINIDINKLYEENIDIIISTIKLDIDFNFICVNPIFLEQDKILLKNALDNINKKKKLKLSKNLLNDSKFIDKKDVIYIKNLSIEILNLISSFQLLIVESFENEYELIKTSASIFAQNINERDIIYNDFLKRENVSKVYIDDFKIKFLHCKTNVMKNCCFGYIRINNFIKIDNNEIIGVVIMIVPEDNNEIYTEIMSELSGAIIENDELFRALKQNKQSEILVEIEKILMKFYKKNIIKRMEC